MTVSRAEPSSSPSSSSSSSSSSLLDGHLLSSTAFFSPDGLVMSDARLPVVAQLGGELDHPTVRFSSAATSLALLPLRCIFLSAGMTDWCNACLLRLALLTLSSKSSLAVSCSKGPSLLSLIYPRSVFSLSSSHLQPSP